MRNVERWDGLALQGTATVGPLRLTTPATLDTGTPSVEPLGPVLTAAPSRAGTRRLVLADGPQRWELELPVLAPEIAPPARGVVPLGAEAVLLHAPCDVEALRELRIARPELLVLGNARVLWNDPAALVETVRAVRTEVGAEPLLWGPRLALPHRLPILAYLGFDLLDTTEGEIRAAAGEFLDLTLGSRPEPPDPVGRGCDCPGCTGPAEPPLVAHARVQYRRAQLEVRAAIARGALRDLVEARLASEPATAELLRYADRELAGLLEAYTPVVGSGSRSYVLAEALRRPEMRRFRDRLVERYRPPPSKRVLLLVPCSRTKPYRRSASHRRFAAAWDGLVGASRLHVVSVSSPIGLVPRELEDVYPARHYDIPVTGEWTAEERALLRRELAHLLATGSYRHVVAHLDPEELGFLLDAIPPELREPTTVVGGRSTSSASIAQLRSVLARCLEGTAPAPGGPLAVVTEELRELAAVQFGRDGAGRLFAAPVRLTGRPWFQRVTDGRQDLASVREERGLFHLTVAGALRLGDAVPRVDVDPSLTLEGDVFAPGVVRADLSVRAGDAVGLFQDGRLAAVGEAALAGPLLGDLRRGLAVRVRHRAHLLPDTAKTEEVPPPPGR